MKRLIAPMALALSLMAGGAYSTAFAQETPAAPANTDAAGAGMQGQQADPSAMGQTPPSSGPSTTDQRNQPMATPGDASGQTAPAPGGAMGDPGMAAPPAGDPTAASPPAPAPDAGAPPAPDAGAGMAAPAPGGMAAGDSAAAPTGDYPPCSRTVKDRCRQGGGGAMGMKASHHRGSHRMRHHRARKAMAPAAAAPTTSAPAPASAPGA